MVPKNLNNPFFDQAHLGCQKAEKELGGEVVCLFTGPGEHGGGDEQVQVVEDLIAKKVDGIAVSPANAAAMAVALRDAKKAGIPVLTWDSDVLPADKDLRIAYVGTHNYDIGVNLAKAVQLIKPKGGTICIQSGGAAAANHNERMQGIRDTLSGKASAKSPGDRLTGQNGWTEVDGCPLYTNDDFRCRCSRWKTSSASIRSSTPSCRPAASRSSCPTPTSTSSRSTRPRSPAATGARRRRHAARPDRSAEGRLIDRPPFSRSIWTGSVSATTSASSPLAILSLYFSTTCL